MATPPPPIPTHPDADADAGGGGGGEDRLSALPQDLLISILVRVNAAAAARTSVLASRWRHLWALLPELVFPSGTEHRRVLAALAAHEAPRLCAIRVVTRDASTESLAAWLAIAARRLSGRLVLRVARPEDEAEERGAVDLPCFEEAERIKIALGFLRLAPPPSGVFARLKDLELADVRLRGESGLGDALSSPRCPCLQLLLLSDVRGLDSFAIHSESLLELKLRDLPDLLHLAVVAPELRELQVACCFADGPNPVAYISTPRLVFLQWMGSPSSVRFGEMTQLQRLTVAIFLVYGPNLAVPFNRSLTSLLQRFHRLTVLNLVLAYPDRQVIAGNYKYLMEDMTRMPEVSFLTLDIEARGHSFGASLFHLLRMYCGVAVLKINFFYTPSRPQPQPACPTGCICDQPPNWKTEELGLNCLEDVEIWNFRGTEHEVVLLKRLFSWTIVLKRMTVNFHRSVSKSKGEELTHLLLSFSRPEICMNCNM